MPKKSSTPVATSDTLGIKDITALSGLSQQYVRKAIRSGKLPVVKGTVGDSRIPKNYIKRADFEAWRETVKAHSPREDGRNKFVLYLSEIEEADLRKLIDNLPFGETLKRANLRTAPETDTPDE